MAKDTGDQKAAEDQKNDSKSETEQNKASAAKRQAENESKKNESKSEAKQEQSQPDGKETSFLNTDTFDNPDAKGLVAFQTATDGQGVERIIGPAPTAWSPAPLEATDEQKQAAEKRVQAFEEASKSRQAKLGEEIKDEDRAVNNPADGGSQQTPAL